MTLNMIFLLKIIAFIAFCLAAAGVPARINLVAMGLALWILTTFI